MNSFNYEQLSARTASPDFHINLVSEECFIDVLNDAITALNKLDVVKKALFYGKQPSAETFPNPFEDKESQIGVGHLHPDLQKAVDLLHSAIGSATESGEKLEAILKSLVSQTPVDLVNYGEEVGDGQWYDAMAVRVLGTTLEASQRINIAKLQKRYPDKFSGVLALERDLQGEREILEGAPNPVMHNWFFVGHLLFGDVTGHPVYGDQQEISTSRVHPEDSAKAHAKQLKKGDTVRTQNTVYTLGEEA